MSSDDLWCPVCRAHHAPCAQIPSDLTPLRELATEATPEVRNALAILAARRAWLAEVRKVWPSAHGGTAELLAAAAVIEAERDTLRARVGELEARTLGYETDLAEVDQTLGRALGYPLAPNTATTVCTGDHTPASLAVEAAKRIGELERERDEADVWLSQSGTWRWTARASLPPMSPTEEEPPVWTHSPGMGFCATEEQATEQAVAWLRARCVAVHGRCG